MIRPRHAWMLLALATGCSDSTSDHFSASREALGQMCAPFAVSPDGALTGAPGPTVVASDGKDFLLGGGGRVGRMRADGTLLEPGGIKFSDVDDHFVGEPVFAFDGTDYLIAVGVSDLQGNGGAIHLTRLAPDGTIRDPVPRSIDAPGVGQYGVACDGKACLVVWSQGDWPGQKNWVRAARVGVDGTILDPKGIDLSPVYMGGTGGSAAVAFNGTNYLAVWGRGYARVTPGGVLLDPPGTHVAGGDQVASAGGQFLMVFQTLRNPPPPGVWHPAIGAIFIDGNGNEVRADYELVVGDAMVPRGPGSYPCSNRPVITSDGQQYVVAWSDGDKTCATTLFVVQTNGTITAQAALPIPGLPRGGTYPSVAAGGGLFVVAEDAPSGRRVARLGQDLTLLGDELAAVQAAQETGIVVVSGDHEYLAVWRDNRISVPPDTFNTGIFAARVQSDGTVVDPKAIPIGTPLAKGGSIADQAAVASDGQDFLIVWSKTSSYDDSNHAIGQPDELRATLVPHSGPLPNPDGVLLDVGDFFDSVTTTFTGNGYLVIFENGDTGKVAAIPLSRSGTVIGPAKPLDPSGFGIACSWNGQNVVVLREAGDFEGDAGFVHRIEKFSLTPAGDYAAGGQAKPILVGTGGASGISIVPAAGGFMLAVGGYPFETVSLFRLDAAGDLAAPQPFAQVAAGQAYEYGGLAWDGTQWIVGWRTDPAGKHVPGASKAYYARIKADGTVLDPAGVNLPDLPNGYGATGGLWVAALPDGNALAAYEPLSKINPPDGYRTWAQPLACKLGAGNPCKVDGDCYSNQCAMGTCAALPHLMTWQVPVDGGDDGGGLDGGTPADAFDDASMTVDGATVDAPTQAKDARFVVDAASTDALYVDDANSQDAGAGWVDHGCGCRVASTRTRKSTSAGWVLAAVVIAVGWRRRRASC